MAIDKVLRGIPFLRQELTKIFMKRASDKSGIMQIPFKNKKLQLDIEDRVQKYVRDAEKQGVDLDMVSNENLKYTINLNENVDPISRVISADSSEGRAITEKLFGKKGGDVNIYSKQYIDNLDKEIIDSGLYTKKEWTNLSDELKEARRRKFDPNYDDAMEGMVESNVVDMTGKNIDTSQGIMGGKSVAELMKSGQVTKGASGMKKSKKVQDREMFENSNLNKTDAQIKAEIEASNKKSLSKMETNNFSLNTITKIKSMKPMDAMKEANLVAGKKGRYANLDDNQVKKIIDDTNDHIFERDIPIDPEDMADGGVAGLLGERPGYQDGLKVYPKITASKSNQGLGDGKNVDLQDLTYGGTLMYDQGPFSTGIEYLKGKDKFDFKDIDDTLAKDTTDRELANLILMMKLKNGLIKFKGNKDNQMINISKSFAQGGPARQNFVMGKRAFLKLMGGVGAGIAGLKSGLLGFSKGATKKTVTETVKKAAGSGEVPPYFFKLVDKIKTMGDETLASQDKAIAKKYKDYVMEEDFAGNITIIKKNLDDPYPEEVIMSYKVDEVPVKGKKGSAKVEDYEEFTARPDAEGKMKDIESGVPDEVVNEGSVFEDNMTEFGMTKKADGGRIGLSGGGGLLKLFKFLKPKPKKLKNTVNEFIEKRKFLKSMVGETEKNKKARELKMLKDAMEEARNNPGFKFKEVDIDKDIRPIFDQSKDRTLNATGGLANMLGE